VDVTSWLLRFSVPRLFVVTGPGGTGARVAVERTARERGWRLASSPAEATVLVVAGSPVEPYVSRVWETMPGPRARVAVAHQSDVAAMAATMTAAACPGADSPPADVPMADRDADRDGLTLDQVHVPLGPALPWWPAGLVVHTTLQGDVLQEVSVELLAGGGGSFWAEHPVARGLDAAGRLLAVAGWADAATAAHRLRDAALAGASVSGPAERLAGRVRRSRTVRWLLSGVGVVPDGPPSVAGDALDRLHRWLTTPGPDEPQWTVDTLPDLLTGTELATGRLVVASLDPDLDALPRHEGTGPPPRPAPQGEHGEHHHGLHHG
jgi:hypothetical protein